MTYGDRGGTDIGVNRRGFLKLAGASATALSLPLSSLADETAEASFKALLEMLSGGTDGQLTINRPLDLVNLKVTFLNLEGRKRFLASPVLDSIVDDQQAFLIVSLPGQHILEEQSEESEPTLTLPVKAFLSDRSTLVFRVPNEILPLPYSIESLLRWEDFELVIRPPAMPMCQPEHETSIVFPSRLAFVPDAPTTITAPARPRIIGGRTELWRADLSRSSLRAIWTPDHRDPDCEPVIVDGPPPFDAPLNEPGVRRDIALSARRVSIAEPNARPIDARTLALSSLGAWADLRGSWDPPAQGDLVEWENRSTMGRDNRVKVVRSGYLYPWGHKAVLVQLTERKILPSPAGPDAAYLRYRFFLVITQPVRRYRHPDVTLDLAHPRQPFRSIEFITTKTPTLDAWRPNPAPAPAVPDGNINNHGRTAFWPKVGGTEFRFAIEVRDWTDRLASTEVTGIFVGLEQAQDPVVFAEIEQAYRSEMSSRTGTPVTRPGLRRAAFRGQPVAFAAENERDDTTAETSSVTFGGERRQNAPQGDLDFPFSAILSSASVRIPAVSQIAGFSDNLEVTYDDRIDPAHPENNPAELFLAVTNTPHLDFASLGSDKAGGVATPSMQISAVSRGTGPVGGDTTPLFEGNFQPDGFFPADAKLLGGVKMGDVMDKAKVKDMLPFCDGTGDQERSSMPKFGIAYNVTDTNPTGDFDGKERICFNFDWETKKVKSFLPVLEVFDDTCLRLQTSVCFGGDDAVEFSQQRGRLTDFRFTIPKVIRIHFAYFDFERVEGRPLRVDVELIEETQGRRKIELLAALKWVDKLITAIKNKMPGGGGGGIGKHFDYDISVDAVKLFAKYEVPRIPLFVLDLSRIELRLGLEFPLLGDDGCLFILEFSTRKDPFGITVGPFAGGGFFGIGFVTDELRRIEGALEFGGRKEIGISGAKGEVFVMVGIYYGMKVEDGQKRQELAAYLRAGGSLQIIKLIRVSLEFYLVLMYIEDDGSPDDNSLCGEATIKVKVSIAFFSTTVSLNFRKCFKGGGADDEPDSAGLLSPMFIDAAVADTPDSPSQMSFHDAVNGRDGWREYWQAFAT